MGQFFAQRILLSFCLWHICHCQNRIPDYSADLERYVSRPDLRPPKFRVDVLETDRVTPGYWFVTPYVDLWARPPTALYQPSQIGPHMYDNHGQLVWSGAHLFPQRSTFDFKAIPHEGRSDFQDLTFLVSPNEHEKAATAGAGILLDNWYNQIAEVHVAKGAGTINMHEFSVVDDGKHSITLTHQIRHFQSREPEFSGWIIDLGFVETEIATGKVSFEWWSSDHVNPTESSYSPPNDINKAGHAWDYFHINSVDKDKNGDYLVSGRHTSTIYMVSGKDGSVMWRLGGKNTDFEQKGFNFSFQHDARLRSTNETGTTLTFMNNASDGPHHSAEWSAAMTVFVDTSSMVAHVVSKLDRPDHQHSNLRGNVQELPSGNTFVCWSDNSYISEFDSSGELILSAQFASKRFATYRAYKFNFTGIPHEPPALVCSAYGQTASTATTACYVSWNGATEVHSWNFWAPGKNIWGQRQLEYLGNAQRNGFETVFMADGLHRRVFVEALDENKSSLRNSTIARTRVPENIKSADDGGDFKQLWGLSAGAGSSRRGSPFMAIFYIVLGAAGVMIISSIRKCLIRRRRIRFLDVEK